MEHSLTTTEALARLEEPFASKDVKWLVAAISRDGRKGRVTPYADPRASCGRTSTTKAECPGVKEQSAFAEQVPHIPDLCAPC